LIKSVFDKFKDLKHTKRELHVNIILLAIFFLLPGDSYEMKFLLHFWAEIWVVYWGIPKDWSKHIFYSACIL